MALLTFFGVPDRWKATVSSAAFAAAFGVVVPSSAVAVPAQLENADEFPSAAPAAAVEPRDEAPDARSAFVGAQLKGSRVEDLSARTESSKTFANPDGTWTVEDWGTAVQVRDEDGAWQDVDYTLVEQPDGSWAPKAAPVEVSIDGGAADEVGRVTFDNGGSLAVTWPEGDLGAPEIDGGVATYAVDEARDLIVSVTSTGLNAWIRLNEEPTDAAETFTLGMETRGDVALDQSGDALVLEDGDGEALGQTSTLVAWDDSEGVDAAEDAVGLEADLSRGRKKGAVRKHELDLTVPDGFLTDADTQYPVIIDPNISALGTARDTWVRSGTTTVQGDSERLIVGVTGTTNPNQALSYVQWDNDARIAGKTIVAADLTLFQYYGEACGNWRTEVHPLTSAFTAGSTVWTNRPGVNTGSSVSTSFTTSRGGDGCANTSNGPVTVSIKSMVAMWAKTPASNFGLQLRAGSTAKSYGKRFCSFNQNAADSVCNTASRSPKLSVTYSQPPATPALATYVAQGPSAGWTNVKRPVLKTSANGYGDQVKYELQVHTSTEGTAASLKASCTTALVASGATGSCAPGADLTNGVYRVRAKAVNQHGLPSAWTGWADLKVDVVAPSAPTITSSAYSQSGTWLPAKPPSNTFTIKAGTAADVVRYEIQQDGQTPQTVSIAQSASYTHAWNPTGGHTLSVRSVDGASNKSAWTNFIFGAGPPAMTSPSAGGTKATSRVPVAAQGATDGDVAASLQWRQHGHKSAEEGWSAPTSLAVSVKNGVANTSGSLDVQAIAKDLGRSRLHTVLQTRVCFSYAQGTGAKCSDPRDVVYVPHAFGDGFPIAEAGPGQVALWTGEFLTSATDASVPGYTGDLSLSRTYASFDAGAQSGAFGPGWSASFDASVGGGASFDVEDSTKVDGTIALVDEEFNAYLFGHESRLKGERQEGRYLPLDDDTAATETALSITSDGLLELTEADGTRTTWKYHSGEEDWLVESVDEPGSSSAATFSRDAVGRVTRVLAPIPPVEGGAAISCSGAGQAGCRYLEITYGEANAGGDRAGQVKSISYTAFDPQTSSMLKTVVATYVYDSTSGRLVKVTDPRTGLATSYSYDGLSPSGVPLLTGITPSGLAGFMMSYGKVTSEGTTLTSALKSVHRAAGTGVSSARVAAFGYFRPVSTSGTAALSAADVEAWKQKAPATAGFVVLGQDAPATADPQFVTGDATRYGDWQYTDPQGYTVNTASWGGESWLVTAEDYVDGRVVRSFDAQGLAAFRNKAAAGLGHLGPDAFATLTRFNEVVTSRGTELVAAGARVVDQWEPVRVVDGVPVRVHTHTDYDQGAPGTNPATGRAWNLATTITTRQAPGTSGTWNPAGVVALEGDVLTEQRLGYDPIDGASSTGATSGWVLGSPTRSTTVNGDENLTTLTRYDAEGRTVEVRKPGSDGSDARTSHTSYYTAGAQPGAPTCASKPQWAGLACETRSGEATPTVPTTRVETYSYYLGAAKTTETLNGAARTTTTVFDSAGRVEQAGTVATGVDSEPVARTKNVYDAATGLQVATESLNAAGSVAGRISETFDGWGRTRTYVDTDGAITTTTYDAAGRVATMTDGQKRVTTNTYAPYTGYLTSQTVSGVGTFTATYDQFGQMISQQLPGGVTQESDYDSSGEEVASRYLLTGVDGPVVAGAWAMTHDVQGRIMTLSAADATLTDRLTSYAYDAAGRLVRAGERAAEQCVTRAYRFDVAGNRTRLATTTGEDCASGTTVEQAWTYDKADRVQTGANGEGDYVYDKLGRQTLLPGVDSPAGAAAGDISLEYFADDLPRAITQGGNRTQFALDPAARRSTTTITPAEGEVATTVRHYTDASDNPAWVTMTSGGMTTSTAYVGSIGGDLAVTVIKDDAGERASVGLVDPIGSVVNTVPIVDGTATDLDAWTSYDEYGNAGALPATGAVSYGWLGGKERATDSAGLVLMGVRLYNSATGLFTSVDPVEGGNETVYGYPNDPVNKLDLDGRKSWWSRNWKKVVAVAVVVAVVGVCVAATAACVTVASTAVRTGARVLAKAGRGVKAGGRAIKKASGREIKIGKNFRIAPLGNRTGHPTGRFPHYHRRVVVKETGKTAPGQGIGRHRPWDKKATDTRLRDRF